MGSTLLYFYLILMIGPFFTVKSHEWSPDFLIIGAQKSGTTALQSYINSHPKVVKKLEEVHFFDLNFDKGALWYENQFPAKTHSDFIIGDRSPYYLFHPQAPQRVHALYPNVKIIIILRNPVERAYSHYQMNIDNQYETLPFEEALKVEPERLSGEIEKVIAHSEYSSDALRRFSYVSRGIYAPQIKRWMDYFSLGQMLIISSSDLHSRPNRVLKEVFAFLGLPAFKVVAKTVNKRHYPPMNPKTRQLLSAFFLPHNRELENLLQRSFRWE